MTCNLVSMVAASADVRSLCCFTSRAGLHGLGQVMMMMMMKRSEADAQNTELEIMQAAADPAEESARL
ncbi:hypothetical protein F2P79_023362 [Pimephales promelas]|nr:hypothetical protein F2P79_023362 [Pimephales promelas]